VFLSGSVDSHHQLVIAESDHSSHVQQLSFKVNDIEDLRQAHDRAIAAGATGIRPWDHGNAWSVYFFDPDQNLVEVYMDTIFHVSQPHGRKIDFNQTDEEILQYTFQAIKDDPTFCYMEEWKDKLAKRLHDNSN
jgi:catechol 2,3-dioxygenase